MRVSKDITAFPYAYGYTENGRLYVRTHATCVEEITYNNIIGVNLVDFAFLNYDILKGCMIELFAIFFAAEKEGREASFIASALVQKIEPLFGVNTYLALYLTGYIDFLLTGTIDARLYTDISGDDLKRVKEAVVESKKTVYLTQ